MRQIPEQNDVIVLGAGAAGLACAASLVRAGRRPLVLEARSRLGGRIHTLHERGVGLPIELGAEFVHGRPSELVTIARAAGLPLCAADGDSWRRGRRGLARFAGLNAQLAATLGRMRVQRDASVVEAIARTGASPEARATAAAFVQGFEAAPPDETSAQWILRANITGGGIAREAMRFVDGYDGIIGWLRGAATVEGSDTIRTCVVAKRVEWRPGRVRVSCISPTGSPLETLQARRLVVTLPVGVLRGAPDSVGAVSFDPPLPPRHERALRLLGMGHALRLTLGFRKPLWPERLGFMQTPSEPIPTWWSAYPLDEPRLVGWCGGHPASALLALGPTRVLDRAVVSLSHALRISRARIEGELSGWWMHDWSADPFARGAYAFACVGGSMAWRNLRAPIDDTLFFAGEATCDAPTAGTVHGAIASGRRVALDVLAARVS